LSAKLFSAAEFGFERKERDIRFEIMVALGRVEVKSRTLVKIILKRGRIVAREPAIIPMPGSIVDQMAVLVAFPRQVIRSAAN